MNYRKPSGNSQSRDPGVVRFKEVAKRTRAWAQSNEGLKTVDGARAFEEKAQHDKTDATRVSAALMRKPVTF